MCIRDRLWKSLTRSSYSRVEERKYNLLISVSVGILSLAKKYTNCVRYSKLRDVQVGTQITLGIKLLRCKNVWHVNLSVKFYGSKKGEIVCYFIYSKKHKAYIGVHNFIKCAPLILLESFYLISNLLTTGREAVSYTHLDVYKRQNHGCWWTIG